jgi:hypothetical protein
LAAWDTQCVYVRNEKEEKHNEEVQEKQNAKRTNSIKDKRKIKEGNQN